MASSKHISMAVISGFTAIGLVVGFGVVNYFSNYFKYDKHNDVDFIDQDAYQAVFLTDSQIYFGRLSDISRDYLILSDVYYVKVNDDGVGQLVKLGSIEPHGPKDVMTVNKDHVLFWENLRPDSQIVKSILTIQSKNNQK